MYSIQIMKKSTIEKVFFYECDLYCAIFYQIPFLLFDNLARSLEKVFFRNLFALFFFFYKNSGENLLLLGMLREDD